MTLRTPFFLKLGQSEIRFILSYLNYTFIPKNNNDPIFGNDAYFFGVNINLDNLFGFIESNLKKYFSLQAGSYNTGFGILTGLNIDYDIKSMPIYVSTYGKLYGLPNEEIFTGWLSYGTGVGIKLDKLLNRSEPKEWVFYKRGSEKWN